MSQVYDSAMIAVMREMSPAEKLALVSDMHRTARDAIRERLRFNYPEWSHEQLDQETANLLFQGESDNTFEVALRLDANGQFVIDAVNRFE